MNPLAVIEAHIAEFQALGARRIGVFGSFGRGEARDDSDMDVYVEFDDAKRCYDNFFALHERLEKRKRSINPTYCSGGVGVSCCVLA